MSFRQVMNPIIKNKAVKTDNAVLLFCCEGVDISMSSLVVTDGIAAGSAR